MDKLDILLTHSHFLCHDLADQPVAYVYPPLGPLYLSAYLKKEKAGEVGVFDSTFSNGEKEFEQYIKVHHPRLIGIQTIITTRTQTRNLLHICHNAGIPVVVGGPDASACYTKYLEWGADYVVIGEGEETCSELLQFITCQSNYREGDIKGLAYKSNGQVVVNEKRPLIQDLDSIPLPDWQAIDISKYLDLWRQKNGYTSLQILTSRGCPFGCSWCSHAVYGRTIRQRSVDNVIKEMRALSTLYDPDTIWFADDTFTINPFWINSFSDKVAQNGNIIPFRCFTRADRVSPEMLTKLKAIGCRLIHMGVESGSQRVLDKMNKGQNIDIIKNASTYIHNAGIELNYFIMFGYPGEKLQDIRATEKLIQETKPDSIGFSIAYPVPGTEFHKSIENSLDKNIEALWEKTTRNVQKMFPTEFPLLYYRLTIQHIQLRNMRRNSKDRGIRRINSEVKILFLAVGRWVIERIWLSRNLFSFLILGSRG